MVESLDGSSVHGPEGVVQKNDVRIHVQRSGIRYSVELGDRECLLVYHGFLAVVV